MGFKENLKSELNYAGMMVKELSAITGIKRHTLDNYLNTHNSIPSASAAVKIAQALGVSVEYLITGRDFYTEGKKSDFPKELNSLVEIWGRLSKKNRNLALSLIKILEDHEKIEK
ncbi:MAG: helix-turn-helix domain-containing protein [Treponema sp.]|nr:helix-turn-helix domain-containing protein [Treponema sp.]